MSQDNSLNRESDALADGGDEQAQRTAAPPLRKNMRVQLRVASMAPGGEGVSKDLGVPIFINRVAPGDLVTAELFDVRKNFARAKVVNIDRPSPQRREPPCKIFKVCGGCQWQHIGYEHQLADKQDIVKQAIKHIGKLDPDVVLPTIGADNPLFYRNKVQFPVSNPQGSSRILAGYYREGTHELVNIKHCPVQPEPLDRMLAAVKEALEQHRLRAYDESTHRGLVRHIAARFSTARQEVLVTLVINAQPEGTDWVEKLRPLAGDVMAQVGEIKGVCVNYNPHRGNRIMGDTTRLVAGADYVLEELHSRLEDAPQNVKGGLQFRLSSQSFFQVNSGQAGKLLDVVLNAVRDSAARRQRAPQVVDAYAGVGTIAQWLSSSCDQIVAIEEVEPAVSDGRANAMLNGLSNIEFRLGRVEDVLPTLQTEGFATDIIVLDPPRKGVSPEVLATVMAISPPQIVYVSCNPTTLARDLRILSDGGYVVKSIQPVDMFPQTFHVESVTVLVKGEC